MDTAERHERLRDESRPSLVPGPLHGRLAPYQDVLLLQRAKGLSYERIAAIFVRHGFKISPAAVGAFCRRAFTQSEMTLARRNLTMSPTGITAGQVPSSAPVPPAMDHSTFRPATVTLRPRGPKIARDNY